MLCQRESQYPIYECPDNAHSIYCSDYVNCTKFGSSAFQCADKKQCIPIELLCDGYVQCEDGSGRCLQFMQCERGLDFLY